MSPERVQFGPAALIILLAVTSIPAARGESAPATASFDIPYDRALKRHVRDGLVDYAGMKSDADLMDAINALATLKIEAVVTSSERLAFWINAYNALVIRQVVSHYPIESVKEVGLPGSWSFFKSTEFVIGGTAWTLDRIEHQMIRPVFKDPRAHFALVCGSLGCPRLRAGAWRADRLDADLDEAARVFINDPARVEFRRDRGVLRLSRIFEWYADDFAQAAGSTESFIARYRAGDAIPRGLSIEYIEYSWALNDAAAKPGRPAPAVP